MDIIEFSPRGGVKSSRSNGYSDLGFDKKSLQGGEKDFLESEGELRNLRGGSSRRENERPTPINLSKSLISQQIGYSVECTRKSNFRKAQIDFLPSPLGEGKKKAAFTLAEVLITLGIIGVVAALTLPTLIANYQKKVYVNQLKKSVSVLSNGFKLMMGHDGVTELKDTTAFSGMLVEDKCNNGGGGTNNLLTDECRSMKEGLESVFSGIQFVPCNGKLPQNLNGGNDVANGLRRKSTSTCIQFPDGSEIIHFSAKKTGNNIGIIVDLNGAKNPNTVGRDIFWLYVNNNGHITGSYGEEESKNWRTTTDSRYKCEMDGTSLGYGCAGRVLEEDAMNY